MASYSSGRILQIIKNFYKKMLVIQFTLSKKLISVELITCLS